MPESDEAPRKTRPHEQVAVRKRSRLPWLTMSEKIRDPQLSLPVTYDPELYRVLPWVSSRSKSPRTTAGELSRAEAIFHAEQMDDRLTKVFVPLPVDLSYLLHGV